MRIITIEQLNDLIKKHDKIVFFGGAGVSTESGLPDFRSTSGIYNQIYKYPPEEIISHEFFERDPQEFYRFYRDRIVNTEVLPNSAHKYLVELEKQGKLLGIITQNIDGLHQLAGSKNVIELHGSVYRNYCPICHKEYPIEKIINSDTVPYCECGGIIRPDVVLYNEPLDSETLIKALELIRRSDLLIIGGTSLVVYPAAGLINYANKTLLVNDKQTERDNSCDYVFYGKIGETFAKLTQ